MHRSFLFSPNLENDKLLVALKEANRLIVAKLLKRFNVPLTTKEIEPDLPIMLCNLVSGFPTSYLSLRNKEDCVISSPFGLFVFLMHTVI